MLMQPSGNLTGSLNATQASHICSGCSVHIKCKQILVRWILNFFLGKNESYEENNYKGMCIRHNSLLIILGFVTQLLFAVYTLQLFLHTDLWGLLYCLCDKCSHCSYTILYVNLKLSLGVC